LNNFSTKLYFPSLWKFLLINKKNSNNTVFYIYSSTYFFFVTLPNFFLRLQFDKQSNCVELIFFYKNNFYGIFWNFFKNIFFQFSRIFFKKLKFKGKGYYIYKNIRNTVALQFGYSHSFYIYSYYTNVKFMTKTLILIFGVNKKNVLKAGKSLFKIKPINIFTGKGIRFSRQIIYKKTGKISSYR